MHAAGRTFGDIAAETGAGRRTVARWIAVDDVPDRQRSTIKPSISKIFWRVDEQRAIELVAAS